MAVGCRSLLLVVLVLYSTAPLAQSQNTGCSLPNENTIARRLESILQSQLGEGGTVSINLISHRFSCLAVESRDRYRRISVVTNYTRNGFGDQLFNAQFELTCRNNVFERPTPEFLDLNPPAAAFTLTRRDCRGCTGDVFTGVDADTNCIGEWCDSVYMHDSLLLESESHLDLTTFWLVLVDPSHLLVIITSHHAVCPSSCTSLGQGSCRSVSDCCPFFATNGVCTSTCPDNFTASASTNYTCGNYYYVPFYSP